MANKDFKVKNGIDIQTPLPVSMGGTGQTSTSNALNSLLPVQSSNSGKYLTTDGTNTSWASVDLSAIQTQIDSKDNLTKTVSTQVSDYTLTLSDRGKIIEFNSSSDLNLTLPTYSSVSLSYGDNFSIVNRGTGKVNIVNQSGTLPLTYFSLSGAGSSTYISGIAYGNGIFIAAFGLTYYRSSDGISWTTTGQSMGAGIDYKQNTVIFTNGTFYIAGSNTIKSSTDGVTWTTRATTTSAVHSIEYGNGKFIAAGASGNLWTSTDGITWTAYGQVTGFTTSTFYAIVYHNSGIWILSTGSSLVRSSDNGITWSAVSPNPSAYPRGLRSNGSIIVMSQIGQSTTIIYTSTDGSTWTSRALGSGSKYMSRPYWDGNQFIVAAINTSIPATLYTYTSTNGTTWTEQSSLSNLNGNRVYNIIQNASGSYLIYDDSADAYTTGPITTSYISKNGATSIPSYGRAEIYNYNQNQFVIAGDLGNPVATNKGSTASRPSSPALGDLYFNTDYNYFEQYTALGWFPIAAAPGTPTGVTATNQGSGRAYNNGQMSVAFTPNTSAGYPSSFIVTPSPSTSPTTFTGTSSPVTVTGLASSTQYTYTVVATSAYGTSAASSTSSGVTATTVPQAPTLTAVAGNTDATITITPGATGGSAITQYLITSNPATTTQTTSSTTYTFTGLTNGTAYTFTATATNANGTSTASAASNSITPTAINGVYEPIAFYLQPTYTPVSGTITGGVTFGNIPQTYKHLQIRMNCTAGSNYNDSDIVMQFNSDSGSGAPSNYWKHRIYGSGSAVGNDAGSMNAMQIARGGGATNVLGPAIIDIMDYTSTNKNKVVKSLFGQDSNGSGYIMLSSGVWLSTSAINSITLNGANFTGFGTNTSIALYGIKGD
jgi:Fibronectin type III domain